ncbi:MAG: cytochrome P450 [Alphaproteobacteria bacterium]|nr:MAG: cytochrome P450 [Alphaproteobacteria bacterium]
MRLFTPVPYQVRRVARAAQPVGADLKEDDRILIGSWATNRLASVYADAERFKPDRWIETDSNNYDYPTFSAGPRRCVGYGLAMIMVKITLASIPLKRRPNLVPNIRIDTKVAVTLCSRQPIRVVMSNRNAKIVRTDVHGTVSDLYAL